MSRRLGPKLRRDIRQIVILDNVTLRKQFTILIHALPSGTHLSCDIRRKLVLEQVNLDEYYCIVIFFRINQRLIK